jgi:outer membrane protein OmpA-like peptidoglycan-associated protein
MTKKRLSAFLTVAVSLYCLPAGAVINTEGEKGVGRTISAETMGKAMLDFGVGLSIFQSESFVTDVWNPGDTEITLGDKKREPARSLSSNIYLGIGPTQFWDIAISLPFYYDWLGFDDLQDGGIGDIEISSKFLYPSLSSRLFYQAYYIGLTLPVGMKNSGFFPRQPGYFGSHDTTFLGAQYPTFKGMLLWTFDIGAVAPQVPLQFHINFGGQVANSFSEQANTAIGSIAVEYSPAEVATLFLDFHGETRWSNFSSGFNPGYDPLFFSPGVRLKTAGGMYLNFTGDISLSTHAKNAITAWHPTSGRAAGYRYSTGVVPDYGIQFAIGWNGYMVTPDDDKDGIPNSVDKCPKVKEDFDNFEDSDGCPDYDNDNDGIPDSVDKCPLKPEDKDGFQDSDGCPDLDNDGDGIPDERDLCPNAPEDFDGFEDQDGCPDVDNDKDGIADSVDRCPNDPEDIDGFQDNDGCPDVDNDQDGVPDLKDKCPNVAGLPDNDGCPKAPDTIKPPPKKEIDFPRTQTLFGVTFRKGTAELSFDSYQFIEPLLMKLKQYPEVTIEIHGHTDGIGDYAKNMELSKQRAESVRQYLMAKGIGPERMQTIGFGSSNPIADNKTAAGRAENRRIEVVRIK